LNVPDFILEQIALLKQQNLIKRKIINYRSRHYQFCRQS